MFSKKLCILLNLFLFVASQQKRIVAVGDIHGDIAHAKIVMHMAGATDKEGNWIGGSDLTLVQTGDVLDRGKDTIELFKWLMKLKDQAKKAGGKFVMLLGNHEIMNLRGSLNYVTEEEKQTFASPEERKKAFSKDGWIGKFLRTLPMSIVIDGTVFVHGGITKSYIKNGISKMNEEASEYIREDTEDMLKSRELFKQSSDSPVWYRGYYEKPEPEACEELKEVLKLLGAQRMVMGHTVTKYRTIESRCNGMAYFIDVGISSYYGPTNFAALQLTKAGATEIHPKMKYNLPFIPSVATPPVKPPRKSAPKKTA
ncbi:hypothetical protein DSO57_1020413 [Entomophthora muscae]|uniref:Uncharacterized protein n=1 Tax=Entomophthora muscae TaxID=34485 RepID=A0ACC2S637_9FUNG|nr:hypothetical protein DSO57_1020413 [Entomophthora muscae]